MERDGFLFRLTTDNPNDLWNIMNEAIHKIKDEKLSNQSAGLVVNSVAVQEIMSKPTNQNVLLPKFLELSQLCKSVIGVRLQPNQKSQIVELVKMATQNITLAVGDGANDEPMIRAANVGVGIAGLEGTTAVRAADYAIAKFKFLDRLLFVHGRLHYRRITTLICYIFYKNGLLSLSSFWFGFFNGFSEEEEEEEEEGIDTCLPTLCCVTLAIQKIMYLEWAYQLYNVVFTAVPILLFAVIDKNHIEFHEPLAYARNMGGKRFTWLIFCGWILDSLFESCILTLLPFWCFSSVTSPDNSGQSYGLWSFGVVAYTAIVFCANFRLAFITVKFYIHAFMYMCACVYNIYDMCNIINKFVLLKCVTCKNISMNM
ncbi:hypothetical protein RFI_34371 [Reticulomyxa filosa]|uniref:P-type ATPase C-terminal domain-containing protein n=1 Tax=Reticulomyxa filosa TaxID=46433 RepID=X6LM77_RETFI|nr:hypothetical protein RFI_34371 [Reticulomyxa filosa]|eukprot:ETO03038.1 hypothetical protein RFI_34371 [Reticulomyxa filosa]